MVENIWNFIWNSDFGCVFCILGWFLFVGLTYGVVMLFGSGVMWLSDLIPGSKKSNSKGNSASESYNSDAGGSYNGDNSWGAHIDEVNSERNQSEADHIKYSGPVDTHHMGEANKRWVENQRRLGYDDEDINKKLDNSSGSGCYIATASLQGLMPIESLNPLKKWRYTVLERSKIGGYFSALYRNNAPEIAFVIADMPLLCTLIRHFFITPSLKLVAKRQTFGRDLLLWSLFLTLMGFAKLMTLGKLSKP